MEALIGVEALIARPGEISTRRCRHFKVMHRLMIQKHSNVRVVSRLRQLVTPVSFVWRLDLRPQRQTRPFANGC